MDQLYIVFSKNGNKLNPFIICDNYDDALNLAAGANSITENVELYVKPCPAVLSKTSYDVNDLISTAIFASQSGKSSNE